MLAKKLPLTLDSDAFNALKSDFNQMLRKLLLTMENQESEEGKLSVALTVKLDKGHARDFQSNGHDATRDIVTPTFSHKVAIALSFKDDKSGVLKGDYEMRWDKELGAYVIEEINNGQTSFFDEDKSKEEEPEETDEEENTEEEEPLGIPEKATDEAAGVVNVDENTEEPEDDPLFEQRETWKDMLRHQDHKVNITESHGMYTARDAETNAIIVTSAGDESIAAALKDHVGHNACVIGGYDQDSISLRRLSVKCEQCDERLWWVDNPDPEEPEVDHEPEAEEYEYEQPEE